MAEITDQEYARIVRFEVINRASQEEIDLLLSNRTRWIEELRRQLEVAEANLAEAIQAFKTEADHYKAMGRKGIVLGRLHEEGFSQTLGELERRAHKTRVRLDKVTLIEAVENQESPARPYATNFLLAALKEHRRLKSTGDEVDHQLWLALEGKWGFDEMDEL